jgi:hypothetical protein
MTAQIVTIRKERERERERESHQVKSQPDDDAGATEAAIGGSRLRDLAKGVRRRSWASPAAGARGASWLGPARALLFGCSASQLNATAAREMENWRWIDGDLMGHVNFMGFSAHPR